MSSEKNNRKLAKVEKSRIKILESAKELFLEFGFKDTTITMISKNAGFGYGTAYSHFPKGKEDIFLKIMEELMEEFYSIANKEFTVKSKKEAFIFTQKNVESFLILALEHQKLLAVFHEALGLSPVIQKNWEDFCRKFHKRITENVEQAIEKGLVRNPDFDPEVVAGVLFYTGEKYLWQVSLNKTDKDYQTIARNIAQMYTEGLYK